MRKNTMSKLEKLAYVEGFENVEDMMSDPFDVPYVGICMNKDCSYTTFAEPDMDKGYCEECKTNTVKSATELLLFG